MKKILVIIILTILLLSGCGRAVVQGYFVEKNWASKNYLVVADLNNSIDRGEAVYETYEEAINECNRLNAIFENGGTVDE